MRPARRNILTATLCSSLALLSILSTVSRAAAATAKEEPSRPIKLRVTYSAITVNQAVPWIAHDAGLFKKHGLEVELIHASSTTALQSVLAGEAPLAISPQDAAISANLSGADTVIIASILDKPLYSFMVNGKIIKTPADLKGKRVGITRFGSTPDSLTRMVLQMWGFDAARDVTVVQLNEMGLLVAGLDKGLIDGAAISIPNNIRAKRLGYVELLDMTTINKTFVTGSVVTTRRYLNEHRNTAKLYMKGFLEGVKKYLDDEEFSVRVIQKWTKATNRDEVKEAYAIQARHMIKTARTPLEGIRTILDGQAARIPAAKTADPKRLVDLSLTDELEREGFVAELYKR